MPSCWISFFDQLRATHRRRFVVVVGDRQLVGLTVDADTAHLVDPLDREIVAALGVLAVGLVLAGKRQRGAQRDRPACLRHFDFFGRGCGRSYGLGHFSRGPFHIRAQLLALHLRLGHLLLLNDNDAAEDDDDDRPENNEDLVTH